MKNKQIILFDGVCNLCNLSIQFVLKNEKEELLKFSSLQSDFSQDFIKANKLNYKYLETLILIEGDQVFFKSKAIFKIAKYLKFPFNLLGYFNFLPIFFHDFFLDYLYNIISTNRYKLFGKKDNCYFPEKNLAHRFID